MREIHHASFKALYTQFENQDQRRHALVLCRLVRLSPVDVVGAIREHVLGDDWYDFAQESLQAYFRLARGHVYLTASHDHRGLIKLGKTGRPPEARIRSLSRENVIHPFVLLQARQVHDRHWVELRCHQVLTQQGVPRIKEFFAAPQLVLQEHIERVQAQDRLLFETTGWGSALARI